MLQEEILDVTVFYQVIKLTCLYRDPTELNINCGKQCTSMSSLKTGIRFPKLLIVNKRWSHHANRSGYHPVAEGWGREFHDPVSILPEFVLRFLKLIGIDRRRLKQFCLGLETAVMHSRMVLVVHGDSDRWALRGFHRSRKCPLLVILHLPPDDLVPCLERMKSFPPDCVVCVSKCQIESVRDVLGIDNVVFVPHGVDSGFFQPGCEAEKIDQVLCVGVHKRDFKTFVDAAEILAIARPGIRVTAVISNMAPVDLNSFLVNHGIVVERGLSDESLLDLYKKAKVVLMPLLDTTANNALLEGLCCGLPIVTTDVGGVRDYLEHESGMLCSKGNASEHAAAVLSLLQDDGLRRKMSDAARRNGAAFDWSRIRDRLGSVIEKVLLQKRFS